MQVLPLSIPTSVYTFSSRGPVAQWIERLPPEQKVVGSNPIRPTFDFLAYCAGDFSRVWSVWGCVALQMCATFLASASPYQQTSLNRIYANNIVFPKIFLGFFDYFRFCIVRIVSVLICNMHIYD